MANAELKLSEELLKIFHEAQHSADVRYIKVSIAKETFTFEALKKTSDDIQDALCDEVSLNATEACFILYCCNSSKDNSSLKTIALQWILVAFVPDTVAVRERMLYSASKESLKQQLGLNYFIGELHATERADLTVEALNQTRQKCLNMEAPYTESELILKQTLSLARDTNVRSSAMTLIPFGMTQNLREKLELFKNEKFGWIAMKVILGEACETVDVVKSMENVKLADMPLVLDAKTPSFIAYRIPDIDGSPLLFLYVCPEDAPTRLKMIYSTCKATIIDTAKSLMIDFEKTIEITEISRAVEVIQSELGPSEASIMTQKAFSRPRAPGRKGR